ncbi:MAG TPA: shikimate kinase [Cytophagales bacterium]|jgi:shikimate kinase|nr:shikimate kinase [Cytophagales bacterium]
MKFFLIGLPGSGKTTLGKQLAEKLGIIFIDLDAEIERLEKKTVREIFAEKKEGYFRQVESAILKKLCLDKTDFVLATGGGTPCFFTNMEEMNRSGKTIFLNVAIPEITNRLLKTNLTDRPLFGATNANELKGKLEELLSKRIDFYNQAQVKFSSEKISVEEIIAAL